MPFARLIAAVALAVSPVTAGLAHAEAPWSAPVTIASGDYAFWQPSLAFTGDGHALALLDGGGATAHGATRIFAATPGTSTFTQLGSTVLVSAPATYGRRGVAYLRTPRPIGRAKVARLGVSLGTVPGSVGRFHQLARVDVSQSGAITARVAADPKGNVAAAWLEPHGPRTLVRIALRRPGHPFGRATTLGTSAPYGDTTPLDLAYGANGDLVVAFQRATAQPVDHAKLQLAVRVKRSGHRFGPIDALGPLRGSSSVATAVAPTGRAVVAWGTQDAGEGVEEPWTVRAAVLRSGARRFSKTQLLDPGRVGRPVGPVSAAMARNGTATVAWSGVRGGSAGAYPVRAATAGATGRFGAPAQLAPNGAARGVVTASDGTTTVLWGLLTDPEGEIVDQILASRRPAGTAAFAPPEPISQGETAVHHAALALNPQSDQPAALWVGAPGHTPGQPLDGVPLQPRYSMRAG